MQSFNFYPFIILNGYEPLNYRVSQEINGVQATIKVVSEYKNPLSNEPEQWMYIFYMWRMPTHQHGVYDMWMSSFDRKKLN